jgi:integrase
MASIRKRGNSYQARIFGEGSKVIAIKSFRTEAEAEKWAEAEEAKKTLKKTLGIEIGEALAKLPKGTVMVYPGDGPATIHDEQPWPAMPGVPSPHQHMPRLLQPGGITIAKLVARYEDEVLSYQKSWETDRYRIGLYKRAPFGKKLTTEMTTKDVKDWRNTRQKKGLKNDTLNRDVTFLATIFYYALENWHEIPMPLNRYGHPFNPAKIELLEADPERERRLTPEEEECFFRHAAMVQPGNKLRSEPAARRLVLMVRLCLEINFRRGELTKVERAAIMWDKAELHLSGKITKNGEPRIVPLTSRALAILKEAVETIPRDSRNRIFPVAPDTFSQHFREVRARAAKEMPSLATFRFHDTRHEALSKMALKIENVVLLARASGHRDLKMLMRYVNPRSSELTEMLE